MQDRISSIPEKPGIYMFRDADGRIIYVGKAKVLRTRVRSYFQKSADLDERKSAMVGNVADIEFTVTGNELEALILEASLIKQHKPRYNILLRDDKSYPYLKLTLQERWPRLEVVRRIQRDGSRYFGPYVPAGAMWATLSFIRNHYRIPNCRYSLEKRMRPCIQHQIGKCLAPCSGEVVHAEYMKMIKEVEMLLEGRNRKLDELLEKQMYRLSDEMKYEEAAQLRDRIKALRAVSESQKIISPGLGDVDVAGFCRQADKAVFKVLFIRNGIMIGSRHFIQKHAAGESDYFLLENFLEQFYSREILPAPQILCQKKPEDDGLLAEWLSEKRGSKVSIVVPCRGVRRRLLKMAQENAEEILKGIAAETGEEIAVRVAEMLGMQRPPESIGAFDISNMAGKSAVGAYVFWENGHFNKSGYRHIKMDSFNGPDDYAMMREMVRRTLRKEENPEIQMSRKEMIEPDLIIIDGGREHLNAALGVLGAPGNTTVIGLAKDPDRVFMPDREQPIMIDDSSSASLLLRRIRDEVHRFAITFHKRQRAKNTFESVLDSIYGLGRKRRFALLDHFGSIDAIKKAPAEEIAALKGFTEKIAKEVLDALAAKPGQL